MKTLVLYSLKYKTYLCYRSLDDNYIFSKRNGNTVEKAQLKKTTDIYKGNISFWMWKETKDNDKDNAATGW